MDYKNGLTSYAKQKSWLREGVFDMLGPQPPGDQISFRNRNPFPVKMMSFPRLGNRPVSTLVKKLQSAKDPRRETRSSHFNEDPDKGFFDNRHIYDIYIYIHIY